MSCIHSLFLCLWLAGVFIKSSLTRVIFLMVKVGNVGGREFSESLAPDVQKLLISNSCRPLVRKKAALCLLRLYRKNPDVVNVEGW
jgi:vesicle coat complex subunit